MKTKPKVLIIAYYFPPSGGAGVQRTLKFVKYLPEFGWEPVVLTVRDADYPAIDFTLAREIPPGVRVYRSYIPEPYRLYRRFTGRNLSEATDIATLSKDEIQKQSLRERISEWLRSTFFVPDARIGWLPFAVQLGKKVIRHEQPDLIFSTAPPYTTHLIGLYLHIHSKLPWVVDFRDSWIGWLSTPQYRPKCSRALEMWMEEKVLRTGDVVLTVSDGIKEDLLSRHPHLRSRSWELLYNGFDAADFQDIAPKERSSHLTITYTGSLYGNREPVALFNALARLLARDPTLPEKLKLRFVGRVGHSIQQRVQQSAIARLVEWIPYVSHRESLAYLLASDVALLIIDRAARNKGILTGKLFEYIGSGKPILALAPEGEAAEMIKKFELGAVIEPEDEEGIFHFLRDLVFQKRNPFPRSGNSPEIVKKFDRRNLTKQLVEIFQSVCQK